MEGTVDMGEDTVMGEATMGGMGEGMEGCQGGMMTTDILLY